MTCGVPRRPTQVDDPALEQQWAHYRAIVGARIRSLRTAQGLSQESLALESGISRDHLIKVEHGRRSLTFERLYDLAAVLGVEASDLLPDSGDGAS
jgi:transcriptional regulator with XRE-family HTH domain